LGFGVWGFTRRGGEAFPRSGKAEGGEAVMGGVGRTGAKSLNSVGRESPENQSGSRSSAGRRAVSKEAEPAKGFKIDCFTF